jgi:hypothetical protein
MLVVNLETEVEMGINRAPLGRLAVLLVELIVLIGRVDGVVAVEDLAPAVAVEDLVAAVAVEDLVEAVAVEDWVVAVEDWVVAVAVEDLVAAVAAEDSVATFCKFSWVLSLRDKGKAVVRVAVSDTEETRGFGVVVENDDAEVGDVGDCVEIYPEISGGVGVWVFVSVTPWERTLICSLVVELLLWDGEGVEYGVVEARVEDDFGGSVVGTPTSRVDVLKTAARANRIGCVALGWTPKIRTSLSEFGIWRSATITSTMTTSRSAMTVPMNGHRSGVGL